MASAPAQSSATASTPIGRYRWLVVTLIFIVYTSAFADRANIGIALPFIKSEFRLTNTQAGLLASAFAFAYASAQIPAAIALSRFGVRRCLPFFMVATSIVTLTTSVSRSFEMLIILRVLLGFVEAPLAIAAMTSINNWFPKKEKGTAAGVLLAATKFAPLLVPPLGAMILVAFGWRWIFVLLAVPGVLLAVVWAIMVADDPRTSRFVSAREADYIAEVDDSPPSDTDATRAGTVKATGRFATLDRLMRARAVAPLDTARGVFASPSLWCVCAGWFLIQGIVGFILTWLPTYLLEVKKFAIINVGFVAASPFAGAVLGNLLGGIISDRVLGGRRKPTMLMSCGFTIVMMYSLTGAPNHAILLSLLLFATGFLLSIGYSTFTIYPSRMTSRKAFPIALALINTGGQLGTALFPLMTGVLLDRYDWSVVFIALAASAAVALAILIFAIEPVEDPRAAAAARG